MFKNIPLIPVLITVGLFVLVLPTLDYYLDGKQGWLTVVGAIPIALLLLYMLASALFGLGKDMRRK